MAACYTRGAFSLASKANVTGLNATTGVTMALWLKISTLESGLAAGDLMRQTRTATPISRGGYAWWVNAGSIGFRVCSGTASADSSMTAVVCGPLGGIWTHLAVTFDDATDQVLFFRDGILRHSTTNATDMTSDAACTTEILGSAFQGNLSATVVADVRFYPDVVVPPQDVRLLMDPWTLYPGCKGRYYGPQFVQHASGVALEDESGSGNDLTTAAISYQGEDPPWRPTSG